MAHVERSNDNFTHSFYTDLPCVNYFDTQHAQDLFSYSILIDTTDVSNGEGATCEEIQNLFARARGNGFPDGQ